MNAEILKAELLKVAGWLDRLAEQSETQARANEGRFSSLADANKADAKNYRATRDHIMAAIAKAEGAK